MNMNIYNQVRQVPQNAQKPISAGRLKGMTDINPQWRIEKLTEMFGPCGIGWTYKVTNKWTETVGEEVCAFVDIELIVKIDGQMSLPIPGTGGSKLATKEKNGLYVSDEAYKMATTDALSVACKQLGIGADIYWAGGRSKYNQGVSQDPVAPAVQASGNPSRDELVKCAESHYPAGSDQLAALLDTWKIDSLEAASTAQLLVIWQKYRGK